MIGKLDLAQAAAGGVAMLEGARRIEPRRQGRRGRLLLGRRDGQPPRGRRRQRRSTPAWSITAPPPRPAEAARVQAPLADPPRRPRHPHRRDRIPVDQRASQAPASRSPISTIPASTTPSTTTPRPSATTRPPRTSPGAGRCASSAATLAETIRIDRRFCGPPDSGNGGYVAGLLARELGGSDVPVTLRLPAAARPRPRARQR